LTSLLQREGKRSGERPVVLLGGKKKTRKTKVGTGTFFFQWRGGKGGCLVRRGQGGKNPHVWRKSLGILNLKESKKGDPSSPGKKKTKNRTKGKKAFSSRSERKKEDVLL